LALRTPKVVAELLPGRQARVLALGLLKALRVGFAHPLVLLAPAVVRPLADARLLAELRDRLTRSLARLDLPEDLDDLLRAASRLLHGCPSPDHPHSTWTRTRGSDQVCGGAASALIAWPRSRCRASPRAAVTRTRVTRSACGGSP